MWFSRITEYDIYVGIMWKCFGTPTGNALSGTKEEFDLARERLRVRGAPWIMFYFNEAPYAIKTSSEAEQVAAVLRFREELEHEALIAGYNGADDFERQIRDHLTEAAFSIHENRALPCKRIACYAMEIDGDVESPLEKRSSMEKRSCLSHIVRQLVAVQPLARDEALAQLMEREELASTGIGDGVAHPHIAFAGFQTHIILFAHSKLGVDWDSIDGTPVYLIVMRIHPQNSTGDKLKIAARLQRTLRGWGPESLRLRVAADAAKELRQSLVEAGYVLDEVVHLS